MNCADYYIISGIFDAAQPINELLNGLYQMGISQDRINLILSDVTLFETDIIQVLKTIPLTRIKDIIVAGPIAYAIADSEPAIGLIGILVESGIPVYEAESYCKKLIAKGPIVIMVHTQKNEKEKIAALFKQFSGSDIFSQMDLLNAC